MKTECTPEQLEFHGLKKRDVIGKFNCGKITSDAGGLLLREVENTLIYSSASANALPITVHRT